MLLWLFACSAPSQDAFEREVFPLVDTSREVPALGGQEARPERDLELTVWSGASEDPASRPLLILAHGVSGLPEYFDQYATQLAEAGFVVAAPRFPATNADSGITGFGAVTDLRNQPDDLSFVHRWLTEQVEDGEHALNGRYDPENLGVIGHSLGGATALVWAHYPCCASPTVKASLISAPPYSLVPPLFDGEPVSGVPSVLIHGAEDTTVPPAESADLAEDLDVLARVLLPDTTHSDAIEAEADLPSHQTLVSVTIALFDQELRGQSGALSAALP